MNNRNHRKWGFVIIGTLCVCLAAGAAVVAPMEAGAPEGAATEAAALTASAPEAAASDHIYNGSELSAATPEATRGVRGGQIKKLSFGVSKSASKKSKVRKSKKKKYETKMKATWYTGDVLGFRGSYGKLTSGDSVALNASQRKRLGVNRKEQVYLKFPGAHSYLSGKYKVMDSGCSTGIVDVFFKSKGSVPKKFKRSGVVKGVKLYTYS
jgi:hypothetical protein